jgi:hypothetical protein
MLILGVAYGLQYHSTPTADFRFDQAKAPGIGDGTYVRLGEDDHFLYLTACGTAIEPRTTLAVPLDAVTSYEIPRRPKLEFPSLLEVLQGAPVVLGALQACP